MKHNFVIRLFTMLVLCFMVETLVPVSASAATLTPQQKAQLERQKAAEARKKEQAKAAAAREKEAAKRKTEALKRQAEQAKAQAKAAEARKAEEAKSAPAKQQTAKSTAASAAYVKNQTAKSGSQAKNKQTAAQKQAASSISYEEKVAAVERENKKITAYMNRDIAHRIGIYGQAGYSSFFTKSGKPATYNYDFNQKSLGWVGGGGGLSYQLRYKQFLFTTGAELEVYTSMNKLFSEEDYIQRAYLMDPYASMTYNYRFDGVRDYLEGGYIQLPILMGMELKNAPIFWQVGAKVGYSLLGTSQVGGKATTTITDEELISDLGQQMSHVLFSDQAFESATAKITHGLNVAATAEFGMTFDQWTKPTVKNTRRMTAGQRFAQQLRLRLSVFAEYGVLNTYDARNIKDGAEDLPMTKLTGISALAMKDMATNTRSSMNTTTMEGGKNNPFLVGVKFAMYYEIPRKQKKLLPMPKEPMPLMMVKTVNEETGKPVGGSRVSFEADKVTEKTTNSKGFAQLRMPKGEYAVSATKVGFYPSDTVSVKLSREAEDTLLIRMRPEPKPIIYTLCAYVYNKDTEEPIAANVRVLNPSNRRMLYRGESADDGLVVTDLLAGNYTILASAKGYMDAEDSVAFVQDTLKLYLTPIKLGIKVRIDNLFFATNKTIILPESEQALSDLAQFLMDNPTVEIRITGHTDAIGSDRANQILSEGRANSVRRDLMVRGVDGTRIKAEGKGESEPVATNDTEEGRQLNRRVEFVITATGGEDIQQIK